MTTKGSGTHTRNGTMGGRILTIRTKGWETITGSGGCDNRGFVCNCASICAVSKRSSMAVNGRIGVDCVVGQPRPGFCLLHVASRQARTDKLSLLIVHLAVN